MKKIITLLVGTVFSVGAFAQWDTLHMGTDYNFNAVAFTDANDGIVVGENPTTAFGEMRMTFDGGLTWSSPVMSLSLANAPRFNGICFTVNTDGWVVGDSGNIIQSTDMGISWFLRAKPTSKNL